MTENDILECPICANTYDFIAQADSVIFAVKRMHEDDNYEIELKGLAEGVDDALLFKCSQCNFIFEESRHRLDIGRSECILDNPSYDTR